MIGKSKIEPYLLSILFIVIAFLSFTFSIVGYQRVFQVSQISSWVILMLVYLSSTVGSERSKVYVLMLIFLILANCFFWDTKSYIDNFDYAFYPLTIVHGLFLIINYNNFSSKPSIKDIFIFSLPFIFLTIIVFSFLDSSVLLSFIKRLSVGSIFIILNSSLVTINYIYTSSIKNYLLFIGLFIWFLADYFTVLLIFISNETNQEAFFLLIMLLSWMSHFMICKGIIQKK